MKEQLRSFLEFLRLNRNASPHTTAAYDSDLSQFLAFTAALQRKKTSDLQPADLDLASVRAFMADLYRQGQARSSVSRKLSALRTFARYLRREGLIEGDPVALAAAPRREQKVPAHLSVDEMSTLLTVPDESEPLGRRDRAILELFYASGLRLSELVGLDVEDVNLSARMVRVMGKGAKERDAVLTVTGMIVWAIALVAPAGLLLLGTNRLARMLAVLDGRTARRSPAASALSELPDDVVVASGIVLDDGRPVPDLIVGSFGAAVVRSLPPASAMRIQDGHWFLRTQRGWTQMDDPLARTVRDSERVRRWLAHDDADFVVKVYAAVVSRDADIARTPACAVLRPDQLAAWIAALPPQRSITAGRREQMVDRVRAAAG